jgi:hypothetical protein
VPAAKASGLWELNKPLIVTPSIVKFCLSIIDCMAAKSILLVELLLKGVASAIDSNCDMRAFICESIMELKLSEVALEKSLVIHQEWDNTRKPLF